MGGREKTIQPVTMGISFPLEDNGQIRLPAVPVATRGWSAGVSLTSSGCRGVERAQGGGEWREQSWAAC